jgi:hypothetical protein
LRLKPSSDIVPQTDWLCFDCARGWSGIVHRAIGPVATRDQFTFFRIPEEARVSHASLVLKEPIYDIAASASTEPLVNANPQFHDMMTALAALERYV